MKQLIVLTLLLVQLSTAQGQSNRPTAFYTNKGLRYLFYLAQQEERMVLYRFVKYLDKAGTGPSLLYTDTLYPQKDNDETSYLGQKVKLSQANNQWQLHFADGRRNKTLALYPITDTNQINTTINHAYWLDHFVIMSKDINKNLPLYHYSFRLGFGRWDLLEHKTRHPDYFSNYADSIIKNIKDSVFKKQMQYVATTNYIIHHIATIAYTVLKDSLSTLSDNVYMHGSYFSQAVNAIANSRPDLYFQLAQDLPSRRYNLFDAVQEKALIKTLKAYPAHSPMQKAFIKRKKSDRNSIFGSLAAGAAGAALLGYSIYVLTR